MHVCHALRPSIPAENLWQNVMKMAAPAYSHQKHSLCTVLFGHQTFLTADFARPHHASRTSGRPDEHGCWIRSDCAPGPEKLVPERNMDLLSTCRCHLLHYQAGLKLRWPLGNTQMHIVQTCCTALSLGIQDAEEMAPEITDTPILVTSSACMAWEQTGMHEVN